MTAKACLEKLAPLIKHMRHEVQVPDTNVTYKQVANQIGLSSLNYLTDIGLKAKCEGFEGYDLTYNYM